MLLKGTRRDDDNSIAAKCVGCLPCCFVKLHPTRIQHRELEETSTLWVKVSNQHFDGGLKVFVLVHHLGNLGIAVHHRRVVPIAEQAANMLPRVTSDFSCDEHRDVAGMDDGCLARNASNLV